MHRCVHDAIQVASSINKLIEKYHLTPPALKNLENAHVLRVVAISILVVGA